MQGKILFVLVSTFALGALYRTFYTVPMAWIALSIFFGLHVLAFWLFERRTVFAVLGTILVMAPLGVIRTSFVQSQLPHVYEAMLGNQISLAGKIIADPDIREKNQQLLVHVSDQGEETNVLVLAPLFQTFSYGERVLIAGTLTKPAPFATDNGRTFRYDQFLSKKGVFAIVPQADLLEVSPPFGLTSAVLNTLFSCKHVFVAGLSRALPIPYNALATGLLTGDQHGLSEDIENSLVLSGLIWVVVLSGYHVTLIAEAVLGLCYFLPQKFRYIFAGISVLGIIVATGASAPSLRGGIMAGLTLFARSTSRTYDALRALAVSVFVIILWNPYLLAYDSGFQLSLVVTPALLLGTPIIEYRLIWIRYAFIREVIAVSVVAQLACLPLILWQTGNVGVWSIPANILVMPIVPFSMLCSVFAGFVGMLISPLAAVSGLPAYVSLVYIATTAKISAELPFAAAVLPVFPFYCVAISYGTLIWIFWLLHKNTKVAPFEGATHSARSRAKERIPVRATPPRSGTVSPLLPN